ncbi:MAG TPA: STAS domain-containing protein [Anaeromyxobacter sp.]|nr:STAS domain-containing protein [Anaeromyxobacter sp.]
MSGIHLNRWVEGGRRVLRLLGTFDADAARELLGHIHRESERDFVIDVSLVRGFDEVGVATLARLVGSSEHRRIALRGLSTHQLRILRYLGVELSEVGAARATRGPA